MIKRTGHADLPLHSGVVPAWLADRMRDLGTEIIEAMILQSGKKEVLRRLSDPLWFQSFGAVLGMDWHSSGITTSVLYALKRGLNSRARELGLVVCGGRGKYSRKTPEELLYLAEHTGMDGNSLVRSSRLAAKVDNTAVQDGFQLYQHSFILSDEGDWTIVQQGMNTQLKTARRYHWSSENLQSFVENPHTGVTGENCGKILNLADEKAEKTRDSILEFTRENPDRLMKEIKVLVEKEENLSLVPKKNQNENLLLIDEFGEEKKEVEIFKEVQNRDIVMPSHHDVRAEDVNLKRLGGVLVTAYESNPKNFESLLLTPGLGPRTLQSLTLVSEIINGTPSRFSDPARFSFAHGGKDSFPFPVTCNVYDESIRILGDAIEKSKLGYKDKSECINRLHTAAVQIEENCSPEVDFEKAIEYEKSHSRQWGGKSVKE